MDLPLEIERKFLVALPEESDLRKHAARCIAITQTYLLGTQEGASKRIRRSEEQGTVTYTSTEKTRIDMLQRIEIERELSEEEYRELQKQADPERRVIHKTRWCVPVGDLVAEIDVFEGFTQYAYCEVELPSPQTPYELPSFLQVIREVTEDRRFTNAAISRDGFPPVEE